LSKIKVLTISDHPLAPSGVGTQTKYMCEALLNSGKFQVLSLGGAIKHANYNQVKVEPYGDDWRIIPVDNFGTQDQIRSILRNEKPDILWFMTDPRFFGWLWEIENEIRALVPMVYYHVWDNYPVPMFNRQFYLSNDVVTTISKVTDDIVKQAAPEVERHYVPHAVMSEVFKPLTPEQIENIRKESLPPEDQDKVVFFWNNRNARRKQSGTLIYWFKEFLDKHDLHDKAQLIMHTDPNDPHGQPLAHLIETLGLDKRQVLLSTAKIPPEQLAALYNMADCTINISDAEGFGLATLESLSCGTPIIVNMTGGLQEQVLHNGKQFGIPIWPSSKAIIGSQNVPYIYEDRMTKEHFISALFKMFSMGVEGRRALGAEGRQHVETNYNFNDFQQKWVDLMESIHERYGSWDTRKEYNRIRFQEVA
jgi:glycosyltransferase involved in cell wall biosynthesis